MASDALQPIQGMSDIASPEIHLWQHIERISREVLETYAFHEVRTPILERTAIFERSLGTTTDVVQKEMYTFQDRGGRSLTLRPEGTAGIIRHIAAQAQELQDARVFYIGPMFRSERPQAGRRRQFHQLGVEVVGPPSPAADAEIIALQAHLLHVWGLRNFTIEVNTRGFPEDHARVTDGLRGALKSRKNELCEDCQRRYRENPLRLLDCKNESCREIVADVPAVTQFMGEEARQYLADVLTALRRLEIPATENPRLVRGLDYYRHTVWEVTHTGLGAQDALSGGGRYALTLDKQTVEGVGFAMGLERVISALTREGLDAATLARPPCVWLVAQGAPAFEENLLLMQSLRMRGVSCAMDLRGRSLKAQMRAANRSASRYVIIRGEAEMDQGTFQLKNMADGSQEEVDLPELITRLLIASEG